MNTSPLSVAFLDAVDAAGDAADDMLEVIREWIDAHGGLFEQFEAGMRRANEHAYNFAGDLTGWFSVTRKVGLAAQALARVAEGDVVAARDALG